MSPVKAAVGGVVFVAFRCWHFWGFRGAGWAQTGTVSGDGFGQDIPFFRAGHPRFSGRTSPFQKFYSFVKVFHFICFCCSLELPAVLGWFLELLWESWEGSLGAYWEVLWRSWGFLLHQDRYLNDVCFVFASRLVPKFNQQSTKHRCQDALRFCIHVGIVFHYCWCGFRSEMGQFSGCSLRLSTTLWTTVLQSGIANRFGKT